MFDLDGTLVDLRAVYVRAHQRAASEVLGVELEEARVLELMRTGMPIRAHMALLDERAADRLVDVFVMRYRIEREGLARPFPGIVGLLERLYSGGVSVGVVTSKLKQDARAELRSTGLDDYVGALVAFEDTDEHKSDPAPQHEALRRLRADQGVSVGDLPSDIVSARAAGLAAIGVSWGYGTRAALLSAGAECVCASVEDLDRELWARLDRCVRR